VGGGTRSSYDPVTRTLWCYCAEPELVEPGALHRGDNSHRLAYPIYPYPLMEPAVARLHADVDTFPGHALPPQRDRAGQRIVQEIDNVIRQPRTLAPIGLLILLVDGEGLGLPCEELTEGACGAQRGEMGPAQGRLGRHLDRDKRGAISLQKVARRGDVELDVEIHGVVPLRESRGDRMHMAAHQVEVSLAQQPWVRLVEQGQVRVGADGHDTRPGLDTAPQQR